MSNEMSMTDKYKIAAEAISGAGGTPIPTTDTLLEILTYYISEDEVDFVAAFKGQKSQNLEQLKQNSRLSEEEILAKTKSLAAKGVIFNQPNSAGIMVYRLLPLINVGTFEYTFMGKLEDNQRNREISVLFQKLFAELREMVSSNYDNLAPFFEQAPPVDRTVPVAENKPTGKRVTIMVNKSMEAPVEQIMPTQDVEKIIAKFDEIAVGHCFCRHHKDMVNQPCQQTDERENCFTFGKSARYTSSQGFARMVSKKEALAILKRAEEAGLVHKAYHPNFNIHKDETSICNCCRCCCGNAVDNSFIPIVNATNYLAVIDPELCVGCGTCVEKCHTLAAYLNDEGIAERVEEHCIGCGVCASFCPENAISLKESERIVRIPPRKQADEGSKEV